MTLQLKLLIFLFLSGIGVACAQQELTITQQESGLQLIVVNKNFPLLKVLLPGQPASDRGIEIEFPEHVTGKNKQTNAVEHLYLVTSGKRNKRSVPTWKKQGNALIYETEFNNNVKLVALPLPCFLYLASECNAG